jgi:hypothetical protein
VVRDFRSADYRRYWFNNLHPTRQKLLVIVNASWPTLPMKANELRQAFFPTIDFEITTLETKFASIPFTDYGDQKRIDETWIDQNIVPLSAGYDVVALVVPLNQWLSEKFWGFKLLGREIPVITIQATETDVFQTPELKRYVSVFEENLCHELAHYFYGVTPDIPDRTHELVEKYGKGLWLPYFLEEYVPPQPRPAEESRWAYFLQTLAALLSTFKISKEDEAKVYDAISENVPFIEKPVKRSRLNDLATAMEMVETGNRNPKTLAVRLNNPGALKFSNWQKEYSAVLGSGGFSRFPSYPMGKQAQLRLLRSAMSGRMPAYRANGTVREFIYQNANSSPEIEKANYVMQVCADLKISANTILKTLL